MPVFMRWSFSYETDKYDSKFFFSEIYFIIKREINNLGICIIKDDVVWIWVLEKFYEMKYDKIG